jgi:hypothetical protein
LLKPPQGLSLAQRQLPLLQRLLFEPHLLPHLPQLPVSEVRSLQLPLQQVPPESQALPQAPQFALSELVLTQLPAQQC